MTKLLLAHVLATVAPLLLLDEPTTHLDAPHQVALARLFRLLAHDAERPRAVLTVLHDLPIALQADRLPVYDAGCCLHWMERPHDGLQRVLRSNQFRPHATGTSKARMPLRSALNDLDQGRSGSLDPRFP